MNRYQRAALVAVAITYGVAMVCAFWLHPKFSIAVIAVVVLAFLVFVITDGVSIGRGRDEWDGRR